jgi:hypothetical protein
VAWICQLQGPLPWGGTWGLVFDHANDQEGFIDNNFLRLQHPAVLGDLPICKRLSKVTFALAGLPGRPGLFRARAGPGRLGR